MVESDDLFTANSEKGNRNLDREPKKRGEKAGKAGISHENVATRGRTCKTDLDRVLKGKLDRADVLCSDDHRSYGVFARANAIDHRKFNTSKGQRTVDKV